MDSSSSSTSPLCRSPPRNRSRRWRQSRTCTAVVVVAALVITTTAWLSLVFSGTTARCWHRFKNWEGSPHKLPWKPQSQNPSGIEEEDKDLFLEGTAPSLPLGRNRSLSEDERRRDGARLALNHIVFGIAGSSQLWKRRKEFIRLWWRNNSSMRGHVWLEEQVDDKEWDESLPRIMISEDTSRFWYTNPTGHPSGLRIARIVLETFRLEAVEPIYPGLSSLDSLKLFTKVMKCSQALCNPRDPSKSVCKSPVLFFLEEVERQGNNTLSTYVRAGRLKDDFKRKVLCFPRSAPLPHVRRIQALGYPLKNWHLSPRRLCCKLNQTSDELLTISVRQCGKGSFGCFADSVGI
ncbi:hypothetical protein OIU85_002801 [Salix viminalis]|uniref:Uncharacterized protein n=1 Tax=Salix viminalis TaxID=40686 RepID=A0A9Q0VPT9_SALVM|nr:hypothetical protein OIU85_002801 [Salix viminalis]